MPSRRSVRMPATGQRCASCRRRPGPKTAALPRGRAAAAPARPALYGDRDCYWFQLGEVPDLPKMGRLLVQQPQKGERRSCRRIDAMAAPRSSLLDSPSVPAKIRWSGRALPPPAVSSLPYCPFRMAAPGAHEGHQPRPGGNITGRMRGCQIAPDSPAPRAQCRSQWSGPSRPPGAASDSWENEEQHDYELKNPAARTGRTTPEPLPACSAAPCLACPCCSSAPCMCPALLCPRPASYCPLPALSPSCPMLPRSAPLHCLAARSCLVQAVAAAVARAVAGRLSGLPGLSSRLRAVVAAARPDMHNNFLLSQVSGSSGGS
eukprot:SAG22_NODE_1_length_62449_cov_158.689270_10_plen_319_part_00